MYKFVFLIVTIPFWSVYAEFCVNGALIDTFELDMVLLASSIMYVQGSHAIATFATPRCTMWHAQL